MLRRTLLAHLSAAAWGLAGVSTARKSLAAQVTPRPLYFPRDLGSHPDHDIEWWYITGHAHSGEGASARQFGFQITFFRTRVEATQAMRSRFAARHLLFAHAAVTDVPKSAKVAEIGWKPD